MRIKYQNTGYDSTVNLFEGLRYFFVPKRMAPPDPGNIIYRNLIWSL